MSFATDVIDLIGAFGIFFGGLTAASSAAEFMKNPRTPGAAKEAQAIFGLAKKAFKK